MCQRCIYVCPMKIDIPQLVFNARASWPREERPKGILGSCDMASSSDTCSAMGASEEDFQFVVEDVLEEYRETQPEFKEMQAPINKQGAEFFLNQNSREPVTEPDEMVPLWKILHLVGCRLDLRHQGLGGGKLLHVPGRRRELEAHRGGQGQGGGGSGLQGLAQHGVRARTLRSPGRTEKVQHSRTILRSRASFNIYAQWIREGKLKVNSDWNKDLKVKFTVQDPCQLVRKASAIRWPRTCARGQGRGGRGELHRHDPQPLQQLLLRRRRRVSAVRLCRTPGGPYGKLKADQIMATGAPTASPPATTATPKSMI
jgi:hypothetical protein